MSLRLLLLFRFLLVMSFFLWLPNSYKRWTHAFRPAKCFLEMPYQERWETKLTDTQLLSVLKEPFSYLAKGAQSYVFESSDGEYVLKVFRFDACKMPLGQKLIRQLRKTFGLREKHYTPWRQRAFKTLDSCKLAMDLAPHLTGVVFVSLNPKPGLPLIRLKDRLGMAHTIDPAKYRFVLQKKAEPFLFTIKNAKDPSSLIASYLSLISELSNLGIANLDPTMGRNFGFIDGRAVQIDFGNFCLDAEKAKNDVSHFTNQIRSWLEKRRPDAGCCVDWEMK